MQKSPPPAAFTINEVAEEDGEARVVKRQTVEPLTPGVEVVQGFHVLLQAAAAPDLAAAEVPGLSDGGVPGTLGGGPEGQSGVPPGMGLGHLGQEVVYLS